jgi:membrane-associated protease RseP (regulator of RpoE activity)
MTAGITFAALLSGSLLHGQVQSDADASGNLPPASGNAAAGAEADTNLPPPPPSASGRADVEADANARDAKANADGKTDARANPNVDSNPNPNVDARSGAELESNSGADRGRANAAPRNRTEAGQRSRVRNSANRAALGVRFHAGAGDNLTIGEVLPGSPAARIGLQPGDRIVSVNGQTYQDTNAFVDAAGALSLDEDAEIVYLRDGVEQTATARLAPWNSIYGGTAARTHTTLRPSFENGAPLPADVQAQGHVQPGYVMPHYGQYGTFPQQRFYRFGYRGWDDDDLDDCFDD